MENNSKVTSTASLLDDEKSKDQKRNLKDALNAEKLREDKVNEARKLHAAEEKATTAAKPPKDAAKAKAKPVKKTKAQKKKDAQWEKLAGDVGAQGLAAGAALIGGVLQSGARASRRKTLIILAFVVVLAVVIGIFVGPTIKRMLNPPEEAAPITVINELTDAEKAEILKNKTIEIKNIILGEARERKELMVLEQDVQVDSQWKSSWGNLDVFSKTKKITSFGTGYYNVDLSGIADGHIKVDNDAKLVTITVPHAFLKSISIDEGKTVYEDTQKGLLGFGDLKLTMEQQSLLKTSVEQTMRQELEQPEMLEEADKIGVLMIEEIYQPLISAISDEYLVKVEMADSPSEGQATVVESASGSQSE